MNAQTPIPSGPFAMLSYQPGGPTVSTPLIGNTLNNLQWTVPHSAGAQLLLQVVDASGDSGGIPNILYTVNAGSSTTCHPANPNPPFKMTTTVTSAQTCDPIEVDFTGGQAPYSVSIVAQGSSFPTNDTTGPNDNEYTYINRAPPGSPLLIAVHDATGQYAINTPLIQLSGSTDTSCPGKSSGGGIKGGSTPSAGSPSSTGAAASKSKANPTATAAKNTGTTQSTSSQSNTAAIAGGAAGGAVLIIGIVALLVFFCFRRRKSDGYRPGSQQYLNQSYANNGKVADESFGTRPMLPPSPMPSPGMQDYSVNQYVFNQNPSDPQRSSVALQYAPNGAGGAYNNSYSDHQSSSGRTDSTVRTPQTLMYAHNLPGSPAQLPYPPEKLPYNQQQQYPPSPPPQQQYYPPQQQQQQQQQYAQQNYAQQNYSQQPQQSTMYAPYPADSKQAPPPASVAYANARLSASTSSADTRPNSNASRTHLIPMNVYGQEEEEESELAYSRISTSSYPPPQQQQSSSTSKGQPPASEPQILQHRDAGPVLEVPPAYGDRAP